MILVDTSIWIDHLRRGDDTLIGLLLKGWVLTHPFVIGELTLGGAARSRGLLDDLRHLPMSRMAREEEAMHFIAANNLPGSGIGYVDAHLLAATRLTPGAALWTRDKRLDAVASRLSLKADLAALR